jgi:hypothetical protein
MKIIPSPDLMQHLVDQNVVMPEGGFDIPDQAYEDIARKLSEHGTHRHESWEQKKDRIDYAAIWQFHGVQQNGNQRGADLTAIQRIEAVRREVAAVAEGFKVKPDLHEVTEVAKRGIKVVAGLLGVIIALLVLLIVLSGRSHAQVDGVKLQKDGVTVGGPCMGGICGVNFSGSGCAVTKLAQVWTVTCTAGTVTNNPAGTVNQIQTNDGAGAFSAIPSAGLGKVLIDQGAGNAPAFADPLVQGLTAHDAVGTSTNPVAVGGFASAAAPSDVSADGDIVRAWLLRNGAQASVLTAAGALIGGDAANGLDVDVTRLPCSTCWFQRDRPHHHGYGLDHCGNWQRREHFGRWRECHAGREGRRQECRYRYDVHHGDAGVEGDQLPPSEHACGEWPAYRYTASRECRSCLSRLSAFPRGDERWHLRSSRG